jgi:hypothetical protein
MTMSGLARNADEPAGARRAHREGLWRAIRSGLVDVLGSDHAPHTLEEKAKPYPQSPSGMTGVQTLVPVMLDHVNQGRLTLERFVDLTSHGPQRIFGLSRKGRIAEGYDADFTIVDLSRSETSAIRGSKAAASGRPMTANASQAGPSALSSAAPAPCGRATSSGLPQASPRNSSKPFSRSRHRE